MFQKRSISAMGLLLTSLWRAQHDQQTSSWSNVVFCEETGTAIRNVLHAIIDPVLVRGKDVAVVGDVHGCLDELQQLIEEIRSATSQECCFVFCGDIINKGPYNKETLDYIRSLPHVAVVRGNHEDHVIKNALQLRAHHKVKRKYDWVSSLTDDDINYLQNLPYTLRIPSLNCLIVHAGLNPFISLYHQSPWTMTKIRNISGLDVGECITPTEIGNGQQWASLWRGPEHVYFGHDARRGLQRYEFATGLDTGCVYGKYLTAKLLTGSKQLFQIKAKHVYSTPKQSRSENTVT